jgi:probable HAF family extracellular repeat protein
MLAGANAAAANDVNDAGVIVGGSGSTSTGTYFRAVRWTNGVIQDLGALPGDARSYAYAINSLGQVVGSGYARNHFHERAFLYTTSMTDLGTLGGSASVAYDINDAGVVVGQADPSGDTGAHAFRWSNGVMHDLGTLGGANSVAYGINNAGQVVGQSQTASGAGHAFLYENGVMTDLNDLIDPASGWVLLYANAINESGQIVGSGLINGQQHGFLLGSIPEPSGVSALLLPAYVVLRRRTRARNYNGSPRIWMTKSITP